MHAFAQARVLVNVVDDVCDEGENNSADELATTRNPNKGRSVARMQAKLVMAAENGRLHDWTRGALVHCLDVLGMKVASNNTRHELRDLATQHALPLFAKWDAFVPHTDRVTRSAPPPSSSQPSCSQPVDDMDGLIDEYEDAHVFACAFLLLCALFEDFPHFPCWHIWCSVVYHDHFICGSEFN